MQNRRLWAAAMSVMLLAGCGGTAAPTPAPQTAGPPTAPSATAASTLAASAATATAATTTAPSAPASATQSVTPAPSGSHAPGTSRAPGTSTPPAGSAAPGASEPASGTVAVADSAAVDPISKAVAQLLATTQPGVLVAFTQDQTFASFCAGSVVAYGADRKIRARGEADVCATNHVDYVELEIALDAVAVVASAQGGTLSCLGLPDLYALLGPESTGISNWKDAAAVASALGSSTEYGDQPLTVSGPAPDADASQLLVAAAIAPLAAQRKRSAALRSDYAPVQGAAAVARAVAAGGNGAIGWLPYGAVASVASQVKALRIDAGDGCVAATDDKIDAGTYPISRALYLYVNIDDANADPALVAFVNEYLADGTLSGILQNLPYVPLPADALAESVFAWQGR